MSSALLLDTELPERLLPAEPGPISPDDLEILWQLFVAIATAWGNGGNRHESNGHASKAHGSPDPLALRSQWLEFIEARTLTAPSYGGEYPRPISFRKSNSGRGSCVGMLNGVGLVFAFHGGFV